jgi:hypothetical protein
MMFFEWLKIVFGRLIQYAGWLFLIASSKYLNFPKQSFGKIVAKQNSLYMMELI